MKKATTPDILTREVTLVGWRPIMFDRYPGSNDLKLSVEQKMYFAEDGKTLCVPSKNLMAFLSAQNSGTSVAKMMGGKNFKSLAQALLGFVVIHPMYPVLTRNGEPIVFNGFVDGADKEAGITSYFDAGRLAKGVPNPGERPVIALPWELSFTIHLLKNDNFDEVFLKSAFEKGGMAIGLGTYRGLYGKFYVDKWE